MKRFPKITAFVLALVLLALSVGCEFDVLQTQTLETLTVSVSSETGEPSLHETEPGASDPGKTPAGAVSQGVFSVSSVPAYEGKAYVTVNGNTPFFTNADLSEKSYEYYSPLDSLGRCGEAIASVGRDLMPTQARGSIGSVKPSGWQTVKYDFIDGKYLYNRCHLIGYQLSGENANVCNLITGTRYLNVTGMLPFENMVADYVKESGNHVLYRVTPVFEGDNLVATGVLMEAFSVEDRGEGISFNVFCYNVQPGVVIDYKTGESVAGATPEPVNTAPPATTAAPPATTAAPPATTSTVTPADPHPQSTSYVLNASTKKFHKTTCSELKKMNAENRIDYSGTREEVLAMGYVPCKKCNP